VLPVSVHDFSGPKLTRILSTVFNGDNAQNSFARTILGDIRMFRFN
jgi:hypothetical protein